MVELVNIGQVNMLIGEKQGITAALSLFAQGGRIVAFGLNPPGENYDGPSPAVSVVSNYMQYPPAMVTSITTMMQARLEQIQQQLTGMGITGIDTVTPRTVTPAQQFGSGTPPPGMSTPPSGAPPPAVAPRGPASQFVGPKK